MCMRAVSFAAEERRGDWRNGGRSGDGQDGRKKEREERDGIDEEGKMRSSGCKEDWED
ncbi:uncharacterized protein MYCGRDRAFT_104614 [Zymoseptoria tritici IPO323]|uniref:Uncharacterized protein n=1 Tax=Zymoseptoria tritici (strain CBS 115943 / IPO323) TaxID=336722 RepID=F9XBR4_ZYMTI|nr:uncharacterized protein MYCGRDRAFT_104614 [Zymoseptoria tritici IPO323]EGP87495.1 hypothetical protein MYCGRDRAFT_104614 [Zymoseptoria tritici IPO323]